MVVVTAMGIPMAIQMATVQRHRRTKVVQQIPVVGVSTITTTTATATSIIIMENRMGPFMLLRATITSNLQIITAAEIMYTTSTTIIVGEVSITRWPIPVFIIMIGRMDFNTNIQAEGTTWDTAAISAEGRAIISMITTECIKADTEDINNLIWLFRSSFPTVRTWVTKGCRDNSYPVTFFFPRKEED